MEWEATKGTLESLPLNVYWKSSLDCAKDQSSLINSVHLSLIVINTISTVIRVLKPSSSTHSLQIYCTGFTDPRSHTSCAEKRDPTNINILPFFYYYFSQNLIQFFIQQIPKLISFAFSSINNTQISSTQIFTKQIDSKLSFAKI